MQNNVVFWSDDALQNIQSALEQAALIVGTSDTVFGFLAIPTQAGFEVLNRVKGRSEKPYLVLVGSQQDALALCAEQDRQKLQRLMSHFWPGPLTLIVRAKESVPSYMKSKEGTIAMRLPDHTGLQKLLKRIPVLFSTSANYAGHPVPHDKKDVDPTIIAQCAYFVLDEHSQSQPSLPSTILDCTEEPFKIVREGAISRARIAQVCDQ